MNKPIMKFLSLVLVLALSIGMLPREAWAAGIGSISASDNAELVTSEAEILAEDPAKRSEYTKQYRMSNGMYLAAVYPEPVHYEKNGTWAEIDNTLKLAKGAYSNTAGIWEVSLPQQLSRSTQISITRDGHTLSFGLAGALHKGGDHELMSASEERQAPETAEFEIDGVSQTFEITGMQPSTARLEEPERAAVGELPEETVLEKLSSRLQYPEVYANTDAVYDLQSSKVKESLILESYSSTLRGYRYYLEAGEMVPVLNEEKQLLLLDPETKELVMALEAPFLVDGNLEFSYDIDVRLEPSGSGYYLTYLLPHTWLADSSRSWPVTLDPVVVPTLSLSNVQDQTVMSKKEKDYTWGMIQAGYYSTEGITRCYLMYNQLPALSSSDVIVDAQVTLYKPQTSSIGGYVQVHKVLETWDHKTMHWDDMADFDESIEDALYVKATGNYTWDITDIVREWYTGKNTGMMFKCPEDVENGTTNNFKQFHSSNYGTHRPELVIVYRNNNGLESYWDYTAHSAGRAGTGYINNFTGNLVWVRSDMGFGGNRMPVSISHVYNANDRQNNSFGLGYGWRTNYNQKVYSETLNTLQYYVWEDADGTRHYFYKDGSVWKDEDGLELTLTVSSGSEKYKLTDKNGNESVFDSSGRLIRQTNNQQTPSSITLTYDGSSNRISTVTDGAGRVYRFEYNGSDLLETLKFIGTGTGTDPITETRYEYSTSQLIKITDKDEEISRYTYNNLLLITAKNIDGYSLNYTYTDVTDSSYQPYRVARVSEADGTVQGGFLEIDYAQNQTTFTDHNGHKQICQFNDFGNTVSVQDGLGRASHTSYGLTGYKETPSTDPETGSYKNANWLMSASKLQNTVVNLLPDGNFERSTLWTASGASQSLSSSAYLGSKALSVSITGTTGSVQKNFTASGGETYTFSAYVKTGSNTSAKLAIYEGNTLLQESETLPSGSDWTRLQVTWTNTSNAAKTLNLKLVLKNPGTAYMDCAQLEQAASASRYNLVEDGDFRESGSGVWTYTNGNGSRVTLPLEDTANGITYRSSQPPQLEDSVARFTTNLDTDHLESTNRISQVINISGSQGDSFVLAGWARADSAPLDSLEGREFGIRITFLPEGTDEEPQTARFNADADSSVSWQYAAAPVIADKNYTSIRIELAYDRNVNTAYFDGIQLFKEEYGQSYTYDEDGNVISITDLQKQETEYEYDTDGDLTKIIQDGQTKMTYTYDDYHNVKTATSQEGLSYSFEYDAYGNNTKVSITSGSQTISSSAEYANNGNLLNKTTDALGNVTDYTYDSQTGVLLSVEYPNGQGTTTAYTYDEMYRLTSAAADAVSAAGTQHLAASYTYTDDLLTGITTGESTSSNSTEYHFTYGNFGLRSTVKAGTQTLASYSYTDNQNKYLSALNYGNGDRVQYSYDSYGRVTKETYEDGDTVTYRYDNDGALASIFDSATGRTTAYYYDFTERLMKYAESGSGYSHSVGYTYDTRNNLTALVETIDGTAHTTSYAYDDDNRVTSVTNGSAAKSYTYDAFGRIGSRVSKNGSATVLTDTFSYNAPASGKTSGQVSALTSSAAGYNTTYTYTYDANGNIKTVKEGNYTTTYTYDSQNQLIREDNQRAGKSWTWSYDAGGNITSKKEYAYTTGTLGSAVSTRSYTYGNSSWGDLLTAYNDSTVSYDAIGNPNSLNGRSYVWEHGRELEKVTYNGTQWTNTYDANGIRTQRKSSSATYSYIYNGSQLTQMTVGSNTLYFAYDASGTPMSVTYNGTAYYYVTNLQGDITAILSSAGTAVVTYSYDAWGKLLATGGSMASTLGVHNPLRYRGYVYDTETGFYYVSSRYYDPEIGRWISPEPNVYAGAFDSGSGLIGYNVYAYCANNPVNFSDPTGEFILTALIIGVVAGAVIGGAIGGTVAYNSAKSSGLEGSDLFWATAGGVGKGALIGGVAGGLVGATGGVVAAYGATSVAGTAMITATATITAKATEVTVLQAKKSTNDGDNGWQIANDCIDSVFSNGGKIISPALTKAGTTSATYVATDLMKHKVVPLGFNTFLHSAGGKVLPYGFVAYAWGHTAYSIFCTDPIARANQRGYGLR